MRIQLFPALIIVAILILIIRATNVITAYYEVDELPFFSSASNLVVSSVNAQEEEEEGEEQEEGESNEEENEESATINTEPERSPVLPKQETRSFSPSQLDLLESLSKRRKELDQWETNVQIKENVLRATELRIEAKIAELRDLELRVKELLAAYNERENIKIKSLVKIYENMKPKDAARIFEELDMPVLLQVVNKMKEARVAPILANIDPKLAKEITLQYANEKRLAPNDVD